MLVSYSHLNSQELAVLVPELTVFLFPVGGLEQHGPHLPFGTKLFQAEYFIQSLAKKLQLQMPEWNFVLMPLLPLTVDGATSKNIISVRAHVVRDALVDQCDNLKNLGFKHFIAYSGQVSPRQLSAIEDAGKIIARKKWFLFGHHANLVSISSAKVQAAQVWNSPMIAIPTEHGGEVDTGILLSLNVDLVSKEYLKIPEVIKPNASIGHFISYFKKEVDGYWGKPAQANEEFAIIKIQNEIDTYVMQLRPILEQNRGQSFFQSGYRYFPFNGSFFKAYFFATLFFVLMLVWFLWSVRGIYES